MRSTQIVPIAVFVVLAAVLGDRPASANQLEQCGYHDLPLVMEQMPEGTSEYTENAIAMVTYNDYMEVYQYSGFDGSWGRNGTSEFGGYPSNGQLNDQWGFSWGESALAMTCTRWWCECCEIIESDIVFNPAFDWTFDQDEAETDPSKYFYPSVLLHELGHSWGMQLPSDIEDYQYAHPTVMHAYVNSVVQDRSTIHYPEAWLIRRTYDNQITVPAMHNMVVTSKYAHPTYLTWRKSGTPAFDLYAGQSLNVSHVTVENTGTENLSEVHLRFYLEQEGSLPILMGDFAWAEIPAESYTVLDFNGMQVPWPTETGAYQLTAHITHNGYEEDDRPYDSRTHFIDDINILGRSIEVTVPAANDVLVVGETYAVNWDEENAGDDVKIMISDNNGSSWRTLVASTPNTGYYIWTVDEPPGSQYRIKVSSAQFYPAVNDVSDRFSIIGRFIEIYQPNGGEILNPGASYSIQWNSENIGDEVELEYSMDGGGQFFSITPEPVANAGFFVWTVPDTLSENCLVKVTSADFPDVSDTSDDTFSIARAGLEVMSPQAGDTWWTGETAQVEFDYDGSCSLVEIQLRREPGDDWITLGTKPSNQSPFSWVVTGPDTQWARVRLKDTCDQNALAVSELFAISTRSIDITSPNGGETWVVGDMATVTWDEVGAGEEVTLWFGLDWGATLIHIIGINVANGGTYTFIVPPLFAGGNAAVKIVAEDHPELEDWSDESFTVVNPSIRVQYPNGGETIVAGDPQTLIWTSTDVGNFVRLDYRVEGGSWTSINGYAPNSGSYSWLVPDQPNGTEAEVRVTSSDFPDVSDASDAPFTIGARSLTVTQPSGGEVFQPGSPVTVSWTSELAGRSVTLSESCDRGLTWRTLVAETDNDGEYVTTAHSPRRETCKVMVRSLIFPEVADLSEGYFSIANSPPIAANDVAVTAEDEAVTINVVANDQDADGDDITIISYTQPSHGRVTAATHPGDLQYMPSADYHGNDMFTYRVSDGFGGEDEGAVLVTVESVNDNPVAVDDDADVLANTATTIDVLANDHDVDGDSLTIMATSSAQHGAVSVDNNIVTYTPSLGYEGYDSFVYDIVDGAGGTANATVNINVVGDVFHDDFETGDLQRWSGVSP